MKKIIYPLILLLPIILFLSCSSSGNGDDIIIDQPKENIQVRFDLSLFSEEIEPIKSTTALTDKFESIDYIVHTSDGKLYKMVNYKKEDVICNASIDYLPLTDKIEDILPEGTYYISIIAWEKHDLAGENKQQLAKDYNEAKINFSSFMHPSLFRYSNSVTISATSQAISCELKRITGGLDIYFLDAKSFPADAKVLSVDRVDIMNYFNLNDGKPTTWNTSGPNISGYSFLVQNEHVRELDLNPVDVRPRPLNDDSSIPKNSFHTVIPNEGIADEYRGYFDFKLLDKDLNVLFERRITIPTIYPNKRTIMKGNLINTNLGDNFTINYDDTWEGDVDVSF